MNETKHIITDCVLLYHTSFQHTDERPPYIDYTAYIMMGGNKEKVEFVSYIPLTDEQILKAAYDRFYEHP